jgi:hypothetical protein
MLAYKREDVRALNEAARLIRQRAGELGPDCASPFRTRDMAVVADGTVLRRDVPTPGRQRRRDGRRSVIPRRPLSGQHHVSRPVRTGATWCA